MASAGLFCRAFVMVSLTALNVRQVAGGHYGGAFLCGTLISAVWFRNVGRVTDDRSWPALLAYALGAGCGTVVGMWLGG